MSDNYIDQNETLGYGEFTLKQIPTTVIGLEPPFDDALTELVTRLTKATKTMATVLKKTGEVSVTTFTGSAAGFASVTSVSAGFVESAAGGGATATSAGFSGAAGATGAAASDFS